MRKIITGAFLGTSVMTLVSYFYSELRNKNFKEPQLLTILLQRWFPLQPAVLSAVEAWLIHYLIGILFVAVYAQFWNKRTVNPTFKNGFIIGSITGIPAVLGWHFTLMVHPHPPIIDRPEFYMQLVIVHAIFGAFATLGYKRAE